MGLFGYYAAGAVVGSAAARPGCLVWPFNVALSTGLIWTSYALLTSQGDMGMRFSFIFFCLVILVVSLGKVISFGTWHLAYMIFDIRIFLGSLVGKILWGAALASAVWVLVSLFTGTTRGAALAWACIFIAIAGLFSCMSGRAFLAQIAEVRETVSSVLGFHLPSDAVTYSFRKGRTLYHVDVPYSHNLQDENLRGYLTSRLSGYAVEFSGTHSMILTR